MFSFFSFSASRRATSSFSELPTLDDVDDQEQRDYRLLAGGLALLLSRCGERAARRALPASLQAWRSLNRRGRKSGAPVTLTAQLLMDLGHEIAELADGATRQAARRCLARKVQAARAAAELKTAQRYGGRDAPDSLLFR